MGPVGAYNEWRVRGGSVKGIFVASPSCSYVKHKKVSGEGEYQTEFVGSEFMQFDAIEAMFPEHNIYTMDSNGLWLWVSNGAPRPHP
jgi:hypothetical protein